VVDESLSKVCLDRTLELPGVELRFHDWPGRERAIVCFAPGHELGPEIADAFAPRDRVLSLTPRPDVSYQTDAADLLGLLRAFGFVAPVLVGHGEGCIAPLLLTAWWPSLVGELVLVEPRRDAPAGLEGRGLRECPPDWDALLALVRCRVRVLEQWSIDALREFLRGPAG
jgi:pimeloyl-ACP methyl ester carboxylesterase